MFNAFWYRDFFRGVVVESWVKMVPSEQTRAEVEFLTRTLDLSPGKRLLDCPCGSGRHAIPFAESGVRVTAADISDEFLDIAKREAVARSLAIDVATCDMSETLPEGPFDAAVCLGNAFGYFNAAATRRYLGLLADRILPGGRFAFDSGALAECLLPNLEDVLEFEIDGLAMRFENRYEPIHSRLDVSCTFTRDDVVDRRSFSYFVFTIGEVRRMLEDAGFATVALHGSSRGEPFRLGDPGLFWICSRN